MSKLVKAVLSPIKNILKGVKKVFKKIASTTIGKILLAGVAIYTGGVLFGAWGSTGPLSGLYNVWGGTAAAGGGGTSAAITSAAPALPTQIATTSTLPTATAAAAQTGGATAGTIAAKEVALAAKFAAPAATAAPVAAPSFLATAGEAVMGAAKGVGSFVGQNQLVSAMALQGLASATSPDEIDILEEQERIRRERFASLSDIGNINLGIAPSEDRTLRDLSGVPWHQRRG